VSFKIVTVGFAYMIVIWGIVTWRVLNWLGRFRGTTAWNYIIYYKNEHFFEKPYYATRCKPGNDQHIIIVLAVVVVVIVVLVVVVVVL